MGAESADGGADAEGAAGDGNPEDIVRRWSRSVAEFQEKFGFPRATYATDPETIAWRMKLTKEEAYEVHEAVEEEDMGPEQVIRECVDVVYIALGTLWTYDLRPRHGPVPVTGMSEPDHYLLVTISEHLAKSMERDECRSIQMCATMVIQLAESIVRKIDPRLRLAMFFDEVHRANMEKTPAICGLRPLKGSAWRPPDIAAILGALRRDP